MNRIVTSHSTLLAVVALALCFGMSVYRASTTYLNPDEAAYFRLALPDGIGALYESGKGTTHPPLYVMLMHYAIKVSELEVSLRAAALISGVLFGWFLYLWLSMIWNRLAGLVAVLLVGFAPYIISLDAQARGYTLAYVGIFACLWCQERAWRESSPRWMLLSALPLYTGILTEFFVVFFAAAAGICFLVRAWWERPSKELWASWCVVQVGGVGLYVLLLFTYIVPMLSHGMSDIPGWLTGAFPVEGQNLLLFWGAAAVKQFAYIFASIPLGTAMILPYLVGVYVLWQGPPEGSPVAGRMVILMTALFFLLLAAAVVPGYHPFGRSRHTLFLGIFLAITIAVAAERALRAHPGVLPLAALVLLPAWHWAATEDQNDIQSARHSKETMLEGINYIRQTIPKGSAILSDREARRLLEYYLDFEEPRKYFAPNDNEWDTADYRLVSYRYTWLTVDAVVEDVERFRLENQTPEDDPVWAVEGGWDLFVYKGTPYERAIDNRRDFGSVLWIIQAGPELRAATAPE